MKTELIKEIQKEVGTEVDGFWGPKSKAACQAYLRSLAPDPHPWPLQSRAREFFGDPGDHLTRIDVTGLGVKYDGKDVGSILCHEKVADDLLAILREIAASPWADVLSRYAGCHNDRSMLGSNVPSMHAYGVAVDIDPDTNGMRAPWPAAANMPWGVVKIFARHGWTSGGGMWNYDAMHFQAPKC